MWWGQKVIFFFFSKSGHVAYQIKVEEVKTYMQGNTLNIHLWGWVERSDIEIV